MEVKRWPSAPQPVFNLRSNALLQYPGIDFPREAGECDPPAGPSGPPWTNPVCQSWGTVLNCHIKLQRCVDQDGAASLRSFQTTSVTSACVRKGSTPGSPACFLYRRRVSGFEEVLEVFPPPPSVSPAEVNSYSQCWGSTASPCQGTRWIAKVLF